MSPTHPLPPSTPPVVIILAFSELTFLITILAIDMTSTLSSLPKLYTSTF